MSVLEFSHIDRAYRRGIEVLEDVSFRVEPGEVVGLLGKNGAGKTTLLRLAMGMLEPQHGSVRVFGLNPREKSVEVKRRIGYVSEEQILPARFKVEEVLQLHRSLFPQWDCSLERELIERFQLPLGARIKTLSKGQARQVALLCAIAHRPELLLLDEPAGGLDPAARREFLETSIRLLNESGTTILFSSHYMSDVERMAGRIVMLHEKKVLIDSPLDDLREKFSLALVPTGDSALGGQLRLVKGCLSVRSQPDSLRAIFSFEPEECRSMLEKQLGVEGVYCVPIALEDMFVELVGGRPVC